MTLSYLHSLGYKRNNSDSLLNQFILKKFSWYGKGPSDFHWAGACVCLIDPLINVPLFKKKICEFSVGQYFVKSFFYFFVMCKFRTCFRGSKVPYEIFTNMWNFRTKFSHVCEEFVRIFHTCDEFVCVKFSVQQSTLLAPSPCECFDQKWTTICFRFYDQVKLTCKCGEYTSHKCQIYTM